MSDNAEPTSGGHLDYYLEHGISPVRYRMDDLEAHLDRRDSLYRSLGLPPIAIRGAQVLEVAPGSGQNSVYLASCGPASLTLVEPNPSGRDDIVATYDALQIPHTRPALVPETLQAFEPDRRYDIVVCENWLGALPEEVALIRKLAALVAPGGVLVMTFVPLAGFFANVMRKLLALRIVPAELDFEARTAALVDVFGPHLATMPGMTRSHEDWVHDCMINPHYLNVGLSLATVLDAIGDAMEALATFPRFSVDWRWFKSLTGRDRAFNARLADAEAASLASFVDYRRTYPPGEAGAYRPLHEAFAAVHRLALAWQAALEAGEDAARQRLTDEIGARLAEIETELGVIDPALAGAIAELRAVWSRPSPSARDVREMSEFGAMFGRETIYLSLTRGRATGPPAPPGADAP